MDSTATSPIRPWLTSFLSLSSISLPQSLPDLSLRFHSNLHTFRANYVIISLIIFILTLILHPIKAIIFIIIISSWIYYFTVSRTEPLAVFDVEIGDRTVVVALSAVTVVAVAVAGVWWSLFVSVLVSALLISLHAIVVAPDGGDSPYGSLLSGVEEDGGARGGYVPV